MTKARIVLILYAVSQLLAQAAIIALVPDQYKGILSAIAATVGVILGVLDQSQANKGAMVGGFFSKRKN